MSTTPTTATDPGQPAVYHIRIRGRLGPHWNGRFEPLTVIPEANGDTLLCGPVIDQAALHGVLTRIRDLGLPLLSVTCIDHDQQATYRKDTT
jgi:hypothetical protein